MTGSGAGERMLLWCVQTFSVPLHERVGRPAAAGWEGGDRSRAHGEDMAMGWAWGGEHQYGARGGEHLAFTTTQGHPQGVWPLV